MSFEAALFEHQNLFTALQRMGSDVDAAAKVIASAMKFDGKLLLCGNGGSAADCQHIAAEFTGRFRKDRRPLPAIALTTDTSALTAIGNDYGFDAVFERQVCAFGAKGDVLLCISTSGSSENVLAAAEAARIRGIRTIALTGKGGGDLAPMCDVSLLVPSTNTARIQEAHIFLGHMLCQLTEEYLGIE
jgi:D-sedoheptulose 7-phosphate isomerase